MYDMPCQPFAPFMAQPGSYSGISDIPNYQQLYSGYHGLQQDTVGLQQSFEQQKQSSSFEDGSGGESPTYMSTSSSASSSPPTMNRDSNTSRSSDNSDEEPKPKRRRERKRDIRGRPPYSYIALISMAIANSKSQKCTLKDIIDFINQRFEYYRNAQNKKCWMGSIRHNLTLNECFMKLEKDPSSRGHYWGINPEFHDMFDEGSFLRRRYRFKEGSKKQKKVQPNPIDIKTETIRNNLVTLTAAAQNNAAQHLSSVVDKLASNETPTYDYTSQPTYMPHPLYAYPSYGLAPRLAPPTTSSLSGSLTAPLSVPMSTPMPTSMTAPLTTPSWNFQPTLPSTYSSFDQARYPLPGYQFHHHQPVASHYPTYH